MFRYQNEKFIRAVNMKILIENTQDIYIARETCTWRRDATSVPLKLINIFFGIFFKI